LRRSDRPRLDCPFFDEVHGIGHRRAAGCGLDISLLPDSASDPDVSIGGDCRWVGDRIGADDRHGLALPPGQHTVPLGRNSSPARSWPIRRGREGRASTVGGQSRSCWRRRSGRLYGLRSIDLIEIQSQIPEPCQCRHQECREGRRHPHLQHLLGPRRLALYDPRQRRQK